MLAAGSVERQHRRPWRTQAQRVWLRPDHTDISQLSISSRRKTRSDNKNDQVVAFFAVRLRPMPPLRHYKAGTKPVRRSDDKAFREALSLPKVGGTLG